MTINNTIINELEHTYRKSFPDDLKRYLLVEYGAEPFPYEFSEQDLYANIQRDICDYEAGKLDISVKGASERWQEEREYLQKLYIEKFCEVQDLVEYVAKLEHILSKHGLESSVMAERRIKCKTEPLPF